MYAYAQSILATSALKFVVITNMHQSTQWLTFMLKLINVSRAGRFHE